ncbi:molybdenum cofactor biosynthesis protein MoaE [Ornithinicoccus hortensis]|uniref:molybdenum cofactor biosynthesis protein MoaE n=1 Tax=Ornithinicoccus hortensis TaxID=82346 RepID=UPI001E55E8DC|nr:molybdenum cofactor biosynthesis protein MoaE [Ornithinicoccus hortensis]
MSDSTSPPTGPGATTVRHARISAEPLSVDAVLAEVGHARAGAVVLFIGTVRNHDGGKDGVVTLDYSAHPEAGTVLQELVDSAAARDGVRAVAATHRIGSLAVGDLAVICAVSADHRPAAFEVCRGLIEELKQTVPIWKHQAFVDGDTQWVGL